MRRVVRIAAVFLMIVGVGGFVMTRSGGSGTVLAAMIDRVNEIRSARFNMRSEFKDDQGHPTVFQAKMTFASPWMRFEMTNDHMKVVSIANEEQHKTLMLIDSLKETKNEPMKQARLGPMNSTIAGKQNDIIASLRGLPKAAAESLGKERINGVEAVKYRYENKGDYYTIWVDPVTKLPVRIASNDTLDPANATITVTYSEFEWEPSIGPSELTLEPPAGYEMTSDPK